MKTPRRRKKASSIVPAAVFALALTAVVPNLAGCGDDSGNGVADIGFLGVANIGFDMAVNGVADIAFRD